MRCRCGFDFAQAKIHSRPQFESYAVINDRDYLTFIRLESEALGIADEETALGALAKSSEYAGSMLECPKCSTVLLVPPASVCSGRCSVVYMRKVD